MKNKKLRFILCLGGVLLSSLLQTYVIKAFIQPSNLLSSGFTGVAILIDKIAGLYGQNISTSICILVLNIPVALACYKSISKKFTFLSTIQFITTSLLLKVLTFPALFDDVVLNVVFGGFLYGISVVLALKSSASTGGTDFIALYVSNKIGRSIWEQVFVFNAIILCIFGYMFGWIYAGYSIVFQFISTKTISTFHHRYERVTLQITTDDPENVIDGYVDNFRHGISCVQGYGGFSKKKLYLLHTVVSSYEITDAVHIIQEVDPHAIINVLRTEQFFGGFYQRPID
ncbi:YitT family protein [[Eubacterium] hominis]|uniref:YitT family protein n=1 Tax=[Eubacterium] hominis TaxID=2764325 RepID=UPI003A4E4781